MSLLDDRRHSVTIRPEVDGVDEYGTPVRVLGDPVVIFGRVQRATLTEGADVVQNATLYRFIGRDAPAGAWSTCVWAWREGDVIGEIGRSDDSDVTRHVSFLMRARQPEPVTS